MQYFKPAAGLLILIFILAVVFTLFLNFLDDQEEEQRLSEFASVQQEYQQCLSQAESNRNWGISISDEYVLAMKDSGEFFKSMDRCMSVKYTVPDNSVLSKEMKDSVWLQAESACTHEVTQGFKSSGFHEPYDDASLDSRYESEVEECKAKYETIR